MQLTVSQLAAMMPANMGDASVWLGPVNSALVRWQIDSGPRIAGFIAQCSFESRRFKSLTESLNYSVQGLADTWPSRFAADPKAKPRIPNGLAWKLGRTPSGSQQCDQEALANFVYARAELGNVNPGDGWRYRGRGLKQLTGLFNYTAYQKASGVPVVANPDFLLKPEYAADSAGWYWKSHGCNELMDVGDYAGVTRAINGGMLGHEDGNTTGLDDRVELYENAKKVLGI